MNPRLNLHFVDGPVAKAVAGLDIDAFDLIFIDDSTSGRDRCDTISAVAAAQPQRAIVIIHDFDFLSIGGLPVPSVTATDLPERIQISEWSGMGPGSLDGPYGFSIGRCGRTSTSRSSMTGATYWLNPGQPPGHCES